MIRRWGLTIFFLLALLLATGAWVGSYWRFVGGRHDSVRTGAQEMFACRGSMYVVAGDDEWSSETWHYWSESVVAGIAAFYEDGYGVAHFHSMGFAFDHDKRPFWLGSRWVYSTGLLIIPLWFPTVLPALGLLWAWRRKRRIDSARRGGFEVQQKEPVA